LQYCGLRNGELFYRTEAQITVAMTVAFRRSISRLLIGVIATAQVAIGAYACASILGNGSLANGRTGSALVAMGMDARTDGVAPNLDRLHPLAQASGLPAAADPPHAILHCCRRD